MRAQIDTCSRITNSPFVATGRHARVCEESAPQSRNCTDSPRQACESARIFSSSPETAQIRHFPTPETRPFSSQPLPAQLHTGPVLARDSVSAQTVRYGVGGSGSAADTPLPSASENCPPDVPGQIVQRGQSLSPSQPSASRRVWRSGGVQSVSIVYVFPCETRWSLLQQLACQPCSPSVVPNSAPVGRLVTRQAPPVVTAKARPTSHPRQRLG